MHWGVCPRPCRAGRLLGREQWDQAELLDLKDLLSFLYTSWEVCMSHVRILPASTYPSRLLPTPDGQRCRFLQPPPPLSLLLPASSVCPSSSSPCKITSQYSASRPSLAPAPCPPPPASLSLPRPPLGGGSDIAHHSQESAFPSFCSASPMCNSHTWGQLSKCGAGRHGRYHRSPNSSTWGTPRPCPSMRHLQAGAGASDLPCSARCRILTRPRR